MRSFTARFTFLYVAIAAALLVASSIASTVSAVSTYVAMLNLTVAPAAERSSARMRDGLASGATFAAAAATVVRDFDHPLMRVVVYDAHHRPVAGSVQRETGANRVEAVLAALGGLRSAETTIPGGSLVVSADASRFGERLVGFWARTASLGLVAIGVAFLFGRAVTRRAMLPVARVTAALRSFANGDVIAHPIVTGSDAEFAALADAYRDAIVQTQHAFEARDKAQLQIQQFVADAGHELRTPVTVVMGYVDALRDGIVLDPARVTRVYENMTSKCRRMRTLIEKLMYLARLDETSRPRSSGAPVDVANLARRLVEGFAPMAPRLHLTIADDETDAAVVADEGELHEAIANVLDNAVKYAPGAPVKVGVERRGARVLVDVVDLGPGMSSDDRAHAFDRFYRGSTRGETQGSGLGLAIAKRAVDRMDGTMTLESEPGRGTRVTLSFPKRRPSRPPTGGKGRTSSRVQALEELPQIALALEANARFIRRFHATIMNDDSVGETAERFECKRIDFSATQTQRGRDVQ